MLPDPPLFRFIPYVAGAGLFALAAARGDWPVALMVLIAGAAIQAARGSYRSRLALETHAAEQHQLAREREEQLAHEVATLSAVLDGMAEGVWITDAQGTVVR